MILATAHQHFAQSPDIALTASCMALHHVIEIRAGIWWMRALDPVTGPYDQDLTGYPWPDNTVFTVAGEAHCARVYGYVNPPKRPC